MAAADGIPRTRGGVSGLLLILLGAWGAFVPFIGPYFHYAYTPDRTWQYTTGRLWLSIVPGAAAVLGGFIVLVSRSRVAGGLGAFLAALGGAWFVTGAAVTAQFVRNGSISPGLPVGTAAGGSASTLRQFLEGIGFFTGTGVLIVFFAALALGRFSMRGAGSSGAAGEPEPWAAQQAQPDEAERQSGFATQEYPTMTSQYPPTGNPSSPAGQAPPQHDAFDAFGRTQEAPGAQQEQSKTVPGQFSSSSPAPGSSSSAAAQPPSSEQADTGKIEF